MTKIGFLSFNHWGNDHRSQVRTAQDSLLQSIDLAQAAEGIGIDGAFFRVHHFAAQQSAPLPLLAAIAARTSRLHVGTGVLDMRYENPLALAEEAASVDLISGGRLHLGIGRGSPQHADHGWEAFGYRGDSDEDELVADKTDRFLAAIRGAGLGRPNPERCAPGTAMLPVTPVSPTLPSTVWWGAGSRGTAEMAAAKGMNLMSSTLMTEDTGLPFEHLQLEQIQRYRSAWNAAGWSHRPLVSVSRSIIPIDDDRSARARAGRADHTGLIDGVPSRFGPPHIGTPDHLVDSLSADVALAAADWLFVTISNQLGVEANVSVLATIRNIVGELDRTPALTS
jgi:alkanesulfonate monooxygenase SsuD/methylene tetrahydromethanopterin reductase-like flavin-dependent oxidoreductase (luciferase family)